VELAVREQVINKVGSSDRRVQEKVEVSSPKSERHQTTVQRNRLPTSKREERNGCPGGYEIGASGN